MYYGPDLITNRNEYHYCDDILYTIENNLLTYHALEGDRGGQLQKPVPHTCTLARNWRFIVHRGFTDGLPVGNSLAWFYLGDRSP